MNETMKNIMDRRSIRQFKDKPIDASELEAILEAGKHAPSAVNEQPWHFTVVESPELLQKTNAVTKELFSQSGNPTYEQRAKSEGFSPFYNAPLFIIVSCDSAAVAPLQDGALAIGNMFLAAKSLGIGSCWIHAMNFVLESAAGRELREELLIPKGNILVGAGAFGYNAGENPDPSPRKNDTVSYL